MNLTDLLATVPQPGRLTWVGLRTAKRGPIEVVDRAEAVPGIGLVGDRRAATATRNLASKRQVSLVQAEHLEVIAALLGRGPIDPALMRRNLVVAGINLAALDDRRFRIGDVVLEGAGPCHPCSRMEEDAALGTGGYQAMRGHGGLVARIVTGGTIAVGDEVDLLPPGDGPLGTTTTTDDDAGLGVPV
nr:MOSC domain-containing protein [Nitriliruptor alkaliphilus]